MTFVDIIDDDNLVQDSTKNMLLITMIITAQEYLRLFCMPLPRLLFRI